jgi:hypothetical protein
MEEDDDRPGLEVDPVDDELQEGVLACLGRGATHTSLAGEPEEESRPKLFAGAVNPFCTVECGICLSPFCNQQTAVTALSGQILSTQVELAEEAGSVVVLACGHAFHLGCAIQAQKAKSICPSCRQPMNRMGLWIGGCLLSVGGPRSWPELKEKRRLADATEGPFGSPLTTQHPSTSSYIPEAYNGWLAKYTWKKSRKYVAGLRNAIDTVAVRAPRLEERSEAAQSKISLLRMDVDRLRKAVDTLSCRQAASQHLAVVRAATRRWDSTAAVKPPFPAFLGREALLSAVVETANAADALAAEERKLSEELTLMTRQIEELREETQGLDRQARKLRKRGREENAHGAGGERDRGSESGEERDAPLSTALAPTSIERQRFVAAWLESGSNHSAGGTGSALKR